MATAKKTTTAPALPAGKNSHRKSAATLKAEAQAAAEAKAAELKAEREARRAAGPKTYTSKVEENTENILFIDGDTGNPHYARKLSIKTTDYLLNLEAEVNKLEGLEDESSMKKYLALVTQMGSAALTPEAFAAAENFDANDFAEIVFDAFAFGASKSTDAAGKSSSD